MAETKGLIIEIGADTSKMNKALRQISQPLAKIQSELKFIDKALKLNPKNVELIRQKFKLMESAVTESRAKASQLRAELARLKANNAPADQIRRLEREIITADAETKKLQRDLAMFKASQTTIGKVGASLTNLGSKLTNAGNAMRSFSMYSGMATAALGALGYKAAVHADDLNTLSKQTGVATASLQKFAATSDLVDVSTDAMAKAQGKIVKAMSEGSDVFDKYGINVKNADGSMRSSESVFYDFMDAMGNISNDTERAAAMQEVFGQRAYQALMPLAGNVDTLREYGARFEELGLILDQDTLDKLNAVNDKIDYMKAVGTLAFYKIGGAIATALGGNLDSLDEVIAKIADKIANMSPFAIKLAAGFGAIATAAGPLLIFFGSVAGAIGNLAAGFSRIAPTLQKIIPGLSKLGGMGGGFLRLLGPIGLIASAFIAMWQNSESFRTAMTELGSTLMTAVMPIMQALGPLITVASQMIANIAMTLGNILGPAIQAAMPFINMLLTAFTTLVTGVTSKVTGLVTFVSSAFSTLASKIITPFTNAKDKVLEILNKIKKKFPFNIGKIIKLKLPTITLKMGSKSVLGKEIKYPKGFSIKWHRQGAILDGATFITPTDVAGEAGREAVIPLTGRAMAPFANAIASNMGIDYNALAAAVVGALQTSNADVYVVVDGKVVAQTTAPYMNTAINRLQQRQARLAGIV